jgi:hypothetical protein
MTLAKGGGEDVDHFARDFTARPRATALAVDSTRSRDVGLALDKRDVGRRVTAIWGPDATFNGSDGNSSTIPTAVFVTVFAFLGTWVVARYGFRQRQKERPEAEAQ